MDIKCTCNCCGRKFTYGDKWSPMIKEELWNKVLQYFGVSPRKEAQKELIFSELDDLYEILTPEQQEVLETIMWRPEFHTMYCYECMESALGFELDKDDLIGKDVPINREFENKVLKKREIDRKKKEKEIVLK